MHNFRSNVAERFWNDCQMDTMPSSTAVWVDFFPAPPIQGTAKPYYDAYNRGIRSGRITAAELDAAVGNGAMLTKLIHRIDDTLPPIETSYDLMPPEEEME